ncbi:MAG: hypothetical protein Q9208_001971 [Pyrenodesmia sp. 3 TL-2023]
MPILESKSEAFLNFFKSIQKGKGKENASLDSSEAFSQPKFTTDDWKSPSTVSKDFAAASEAAEEPATNGNAGNDASAVGPSDTGLESNGNVNNAESKEDGATSPALVGNVTAHVAYGHTNPNYTTATDSPANETQDDKKLTEFATESFAPPVTTAVPPVNNDANYYATTSSDANIGELQVTTRSMTASGGNTTQAETSAATEKATTSRLSSPGPATPAVSTPRAEAWPPGLVSSGSEFLKALPKATDAFKGRVRGGDDKIEEEEDPATPTLATFAKTDGATTHDNGLGHSPDASAASFREYALPNPENTNSGSDLPAPYEASISANGPSQLPEAEPTSLLSPGQEDFSEMWGVTNSPRNRAASVDKPMPSTNRLTAKLPNKARSHGIAGLEPQFFSTGGRPNPPPGGFRYSVAELLKIGSQRKLHVFEMLVKMGGRGRVKVSIAVDDYLCLP